MSWEIKFSYNSKVFELRTLAECEIHKSVDSLVATATITLPEYITNQPLKLENRIPIGSQVMIKLGYNDDLVKEFSGYVQNITAVDSSIKIICEDDMYLFRKPVKNVELKPASVKKIAQSLLDQVMPEYSLNCDYDINYEKFVIHQAAAYDVLKKLQEETGGNFYLDTVNKVLHIHPPYVEKKGEVIYSMQRNIENSSLEYKKAIDKKVEVTIETTDKNGKVISETVGVTGGEKIVKKVSSMSISSLKLRAHAELIKQTYDGYDGTFDGWLIPFVEPSYTAVIKDEDYPEKQSSYYVVSVKTSFSSAGGKRTITPGVRVSI
jgi:hypothetical protein